MIVDWDDDSEWMIMMEMIINMIVMMKKVIPNSFMVMLEDVIMILIIMMKNLILCGVIVLGKIMRHP